MELKTYCADIIIIYLLLAIVLSCNSEIKNENPNQDSFFDSESTYVPAEVVDSVNEQIKVIKPSCINNHVMSREEDAYEEGHSLSEEDRLARTRSHEGDNYDDDYEDDYDEGYEE